jgi:hypothetical protein
MAGKYFYCYNPIDSCEIEEIDARDLPKYKRMARRGEIELQRSPLFGEYNEEFFQQYIEVENNADKYGYGWVE